MRVATRRGDAVIAAGFPALDGTNTVRSLETTSGLVTRINEEPYLRGYGFAHDAETYKGMSGGGIFNEQGELLGISGLALAAPDLRQGAYRFYGIPREVYTAWQRQQQSDGVAIARNLALEITSGVASASRDSIFSMEWYPNPERMPEFIALTQDQELLEANQGFSTDKLYTLMEAYLAVGNWRYADLQHRRLLEQIAGPGSAGNEADPPYPPLRTDVIDRFPCNHLQRINQLWSDYSQNRFGYGSQLKIIRSLNAITPEILRRQADQGNWDAYGDMAFELGWKRNRQPISDAYYSFDDLNFDLNTAPLGHLPAGWGYVVNERFPPAWFHRLAVCGL